MKKILSIMLASTVVLLAACTKQGSDPVIPDNSWTLNGSEHFVGSTSRTTTGTNAEAAIEYEDKTDKEGSVTVSFKSLPTASGSYQLVSSDGGTLADNECHISLTDDNGKKLSFMGSPTAVEVLLLKNNKVVITIPQVNVTTATPGNAYKFKASLYEVQN